jgi:hypothetical protein
MLNWCAAGEDFLVIFVPRAAQQNLFDMHYENRCATKVVAKNMQKWKTGTKAIFANKHKKGR